MITVSEQVKEVLNRAHMTDKSVMLPAGQLDRKLYQDVNKVLEAFGGKWNKSAKAHVFTSDPRIKLAKALETGKAEKERQVWQSFYTPLPLVKSVVDWIDPRPDEYGLEPSAGDGRFVRECIARGAAMDAVEIREELAQPLLDMGCGQVWKQDFLTVSTPYYTKTNCTPYDFVVMNPPFQKKQDAKHVLYAWKFVKLGGRLAAIASAGVTFRSDKEYDALRELIDEHGHYEELPSGTFKESGTNVNAVLIKLRK